MNENPSTAGPAAGSFPEWGARMRSLEGMTRTLVVLFVLRMFAAPVGTNQDATRADSSHRFAVRVCVCPSPRASWGLPAACVSRMRNGGFESPASPPGFDSPASPARVVLSGSTQLSPQAHAGVHLSDRPRC
jgi:hypothetical protein